MSANFTSTVFAVEAQLEATYAAAVTFSPATDGIQIDKDMPSLTISYAYDGAMDLANGSGWPSAQNTPGGITAEFEIKTPARGTLQVYGSTGSNGQPQIHPFLLSTGFQPFFASGSILYRPKPADALVQSQSVAIQMYGRGEVATLTGGYSELTVTAGSDLGPVMWAFKTMGLMPSLPSSASLLTTVSGSSYGVPVLNGRSVQFNVNAFVPIVRDWEVSLARGLASRRDQSLSNGVPGIQYSTQTVTLKMTVEKPKFAEINFANLYANGTKCPVSWTVGSQTNNTWAFSMPNAYLSAQPDYGEADGVPTLALTFTGTVSTPFGTDAILISAT